MVPSIALVEAVRYCERGASLDFWAEPVNAISNGGFLATTLCGYALVRSSRLGDEDRASLMGLVVIAALIAIGSAAFHIRPSSWTKLADVVPIAVFVIEALYLALRRIIAKPLAASLGWLALLGVAVAATTAGARRLGCDDAACLNGAPGYLPVLAAMIAMALAAWRRRSAAAPALLLASLAFAAALTARTLDLALCPLASIGPVTITAHAFWHLGTALAAYLVLRGLTLGLRLTS